MKVLFLKEMDITIHVPSQIRRAHSDLEDEVPKGLFETNQCSDIESVLARDFYLVKDVNGSALI